jgi:Domain of unknown function (DUF4360)
MKMIILLAGLFSFTALAQAQSVNIIGVRMTGTGCSDSSAWANTTSDGKTLSVLFDNLIVDIGNGSSNPQATSLKKNCRIFIDVQVPDGFQYGLSQTDYRGFSALPASAYGLHRFTQIIPGQPIVSAREAQLKGPIAKDYAVSIIQKPGRVVYSPCNQRAQTIELLTELQVAYLPNTKDRSIAQINLDSVDTGVHSTFVMSWRACK